MVRLLCHTTEFANSYLIKQYTVTLMMVRFPKITDLMYDDKITINCQVHNEITDILFIECHFDYDLIAIGWYTIASNLHLS